MAFVLLFSIGFISGRIVTMLDRMGYYKSATGVVVGFAASILMYIVWVLFFKVH